MTPYHFSYVYVLQSVRFPRQIYVGFTHNLRKRYAEHNAGTSSSTKRYMPWKLSYYEAFSQEHFARERELHLKNNGNPMRELKKRIGLVEVMKSGKGFTLIEALIAVTILTLAVAGPLFTASRAIVAAQLSRDQLTASYLAQEGIEYVRAKRDNLYLSAYFSSSATASSVGWANFLSQIEGLCLGTLCSLDNGSTGLSLSPCSGADGTLCPPLYLMNINGGVFYTTQSTGPMPTPFLREIKVIHKTDNDEFVVSTVKWTFHNIPYTVTVTDHLTPWQ